MLLLLWVGIWRPRCFTPSLAFSFFLSWFVKHFHLLIIKWMVETKYSEFSLLNGFNAREEKTMLKNSMRQSFEMRSEKSTFQRTRTRTRVRSLRSFSQAYPVHSVTFQQNYTQRPIAHSSVCLHRIRYECTHIKIRKTGLNHTLYIVVCHIRIKIA